MNTISRKEATRLGLKLYFTGRTCKNGHISERYTQGRDCLSCARAYDKLRVRSDQQKEDRKTYIKAYQKTYAFKKSLEKSQAKFLNAHKCRKYFTRHKDKIEIISNCQKCDSNNRVEAHHHDYNSPMDVTFLCKVCHEDWHTENTPLNRITGIFTD